LESLKIRDEANCGEKIVQRFLALDMLATRTPMYSAARDSRVAIIP
jgi:hypothetical protein